MKINNYNVWLRRANYSNGTLAILIECDEGSYACLTVNIAESNFNPPDCAFVDTNNFPDAEEFIKKYKLGTFTGYYGYSGFCTYPLYRFDMKEVKKYVS